LIVHLEVVIGKVVRDIDGRKAGRLEEVHGDWKGSECFVTHYELAPGALSFVLRLLGARRAIHHHIVPWDKLDFSNPEKPRLTCRLEDL